ncbi:MAG: hypothetical protein F4204_13590, partial [Rhodospirillaceae bacterium]|nr:hypothetical protein [Rhodospirillaceae bacterium]
MRVSEKSLELNLAAEILNRLRARPGMSKLYLRGLTQGEESRMGADFFAQLDGRTRLFAFQFKAPLGRTDSTPYKFTLQREQHTKLRVLSTRSNNPVFYVLPFYATHQKLRKDIPNLIQDTWALRVKPMKIRDVFGTNRTKRISCNRGTATVNPDYELIPFEKLALSLEDGVSPTDFSEWYST